MTWLVKAAEFIYDFLADDGWELLVGLAVILPLMYVVAGSLGWTAGLLMLVLLLGTVSISLARKLPAK